MIRYTITFTGRVQGVNFRATTVSVAHNHRVTGWVRNEPDGSVKCVAEGEQDGLDRFIDAVKQAMNGYIKDTRTLESDATGQFRGFTIRY